MTFVLGLLTGLVLGGVVVFWVFTRPVSPFK